MKQLEDEQIEFELVRSQRSTADIVLERDGRIIVRVPEHLEEEAIHKLVESKRYWIYKNLAEWRELNATRVLREFVAGEGFLYLGRNYRLSLVSDQADDLMFNSNRFYLRRALIEEGDPEPALRAFREFYTARLTQRIASRVKYFAPKVNVEVQGYSVQEIGHRWGACLPKGKLLFHWKCCMAPLSIIDYIVVHELCHRHHMNHSVAFWNEVDKVLPDYRERREWLRVNGASLAL